MFGFIFTNTLPVFFSLVHLLDDHLLELVDACDEEALFFEAHEHIVEVLVHEVAQDVLVEVLVELARLLEVQVELGDDDRHEAVV